MTARSVPLDLEAYWMPFSANREFKKQPRMITAAARAQLALLDHSPAFQFGHPRAFELANRFRALAPEALDHVFFTGSGSEAVDTALPR